MRNYSIIILLLVFFSLTVSAQEKNGELTPTLSQEEGAKANAKANADVESDDEHYLNGMVPVGKIDRELPQEQDSLHLPPMDGYGRVYGAHSWIYPYFGPFGYWDIHEGLNVSLGVSAFTSFGKGGFSGWGQNISAVYAKPINDRLSLAIGGYMNNYSTGIGAFRSAGVTAVLNYRFNEHWEAYVYGQKAFLDNSSTMFSHYGPTPYGSFGYGMYGPMYDMGMFGDRIGAGVTWKPSQSTSVQVQFEYSTDPRDNFHRSVQDKWEMPEKK